MCDQDHFAEDLKKYSRRDVGTIAAAISLAALLPQGAYAQSVKESDVTISADGKTITLRLPPSEIFSKSLNNDRTRVYDRQTGIFASENKDLETQARSSAEASR